MIGTRIQCVLIMFTPLAFHHPPLPSPHVVSIPCSHLPLSNKHDFLISYWTLLYHWDYFINLLPSTWHPLFKFMCWGGQGAYCVIPGELRDKDPRIKFRSSALAASVFSHRAVPSSCFVLMSQSPKWNQSSLETYKTIH